MILSERYNLESSPDVSDVYRGGLQLMLHLQITYDNFEDIFPICLNWIYFKYFIFQKYCFWAICCGIIYEFDHLEQYLWERFKMASGFHFATKSPISGSNVFYLLIQLNEKLKTPFLSLENIGRKLKYTAWFSMALLQSSTGYQSNVLFELRAPARDLAHIYSQDF